MHKTSLYHTDFAFLNDLTLCHLFQQKIHKIKLTDPKKAT